MSAAFRQTMSNVLATCLFLLVPAAAAQEPAPAPKTAEKVLAHEQQAEHIYAELSADPNKLVELVQALEDAPLANESWVIREAAYRWLVESDSILVERISRQPIENPRLVVPICLALLGPVADTQQHDPALVLQMAFAATAFLLQHPDKAADRAAILAAGLEGTLSTYHEFVEADRMPPNLLLEQLIRERDIEAYIERMMPHCMPAPAKAAQEPG